MKKFLTIDVGGTNIKYAIMNEDAEILEKGEYPTPYEGLEVFIESLKNLYDRFADQGIEAIAMSAPGKIDAANGYFYTSGALKYISGVNLRDRLKELIPVPFAVENDAKAAALAELWKGSLQGVANAAVLVLGTGIGGAIIIDGKLYRGSTFSAGEFSGIPMDWNREEYVAKEMWAQTNGVNYLVGHFARNKGLEDTSGLNGRVMFEAANNGDEDALKAIDQYTATLASGIMALQFALDVEKVAVGGGISKQPLLLASLKKNIEKFYAPAAAIGMPATIPTLECCTFGNDANMIGALYHYLYEMGE